MSQDHLVKMKSTGKKKDGTPSKHMYWTRRNKKSQGAQNKEKMQFKKFDPTIGDNGEHVLYKQAKK